MVKISRGNSKMGRIPSVSLPPGITCVPGSTCYNDGCYARKAYEGYSQNSAKPAWDNNLAEYYRDPGGYFMEIVTKLMSIRKWGKYKGFFRWHVSGDVPDHAYWVRMRTVAMLLPDWHFLAYSRRPYTWTTQADRDTPENLYPKNLTVVRSLWTDDPWYDSEHPWFKVLKRGEEVPEGGTLCPQDCTSCYKCWFLKPGQGLYVYKH